MEHSGKCNEGGASCNIKNSAMGSCDTEYSTHELPPHSAAEEYSTQGNRHSRLYGASNLNAGSGVHHYVKTAPLGQVQGTPANPKPAARVTPFARLMTSQPPSPTPPAELFPFTQLPLSLQQSILQLEAALARQIIPADVTPMSAVNDTLTWAALRSDVARTCLTSA